MEKIKKNKKIITLVIAILFGFISTIMFNTMVQSAIDLKQVPVTTKYLSEGSEITLDDIKYIEVPKTVLTDHLFLNEEDIVGKYVDYGNSLALGALIYKDIVVEKENVKNVGFFDLNKGEIAVTLAVDNSTTYANSIREGHTIDLYFSGTGVETDATQEKIIYGELVKQAKVLAIYNSVEDAEFVGKDETYIVVALTYEDADLVGRAKAFGEVFPIISYDALHEEINPINFYDVEKLKDALYQRTIDISLREINDE